MSRDLSRLLRPRSVAVLGGGWARKVIEECVRFGFSGDIWPVHPTRAEVGGYQAFPSIDALPDAPDAVFVGVNRHATLDVVRDLRDRGAGGAVLFASGFAETGDGGLQTTLLEAAGEMPVLGPNCYGFVNALDGAVIWPDQQGCARVPRGVAIVSQSSNIAITLTMQRRGLPLAYVACVGNAAQVSCSALADALIEDPRVTALGLYVEGIGDARAFAAMVARARSMGKGVVVLKAGRSEKGRSAAASHTNALAGEAHVSSAFFSQCGAGEVSTLPALVETLKILHAHGPLPAPRLVSVSCSGGEAGLVADAIESTALDFPTFGTSETERLRDLLGPLVSVSNPLDYQTFIWGETARMADVFTTALDGFDAGIFVFDPPRSDRCDTAPYDCAYSAMEQARARTGKPVFAVATLPDTIDEAAAARFDALGIVPLLDVPTALAALEAASVPLPREHWAPVAVGRFAATELLDEATAKALLAEIGLDVPRSVTAPSPELLDESGLTPPFAMKGLGFAHKSEADAVRLNVVNPLFATPIPGAQGYLLEEMIVDGLAELLIGMRRDPIYGVAITLGSGGILTELLKDVATMIAPVTAKEVEEKLSRTKAFRLLTGFRGRARADLRPVVDTVQALQNIMANDATIAEIEINPLIVTEHRAIAVDALIRRTS